MTERPIVKPPAEWHLDIPERTQLDNGLDILICERPGQYVVSAALVLDAPLTAEPTHCEGVGGITQEVVTEGTCSHPGTDFADALEDCGADFGGSVGQSATQFHLDVAASRFEPALNLLAEAVREPELSETDIARLQAMRMAEIAAEMAVPSRRAAVGFRKAIINDTFRVSRPSVGTESSVAAITSDAVRNFYQQFYRPDSATLILAGDFDTNPIDLATAAFEGWKGIGVADPLKSAPTPMPTPNPPSCVLLHQKGAVQAEVRLGAFGIDQTSPDFAALWVANYAMGGAFLSRLNRVLREEKAFTYGVHFANQAMRAGGLLAMQGSFRTEVALESIDIAREILDISTTGFTETEVSDAVSYFHGVTPLAYATADMLADQLANLRAAGLGAEWVHANATALDLVTPESATAAFMRYIDPENLTLVVVGDAVVLADPLRASGWDVNVTSLKADPK